MKRRLAELARRAVDATTGPLVLREWWHTSRGLPSIVRNRLTERDELRRLPAPIVADVVTVIPTYRRPELLAKAVASALAQDVPRHAVVVVSDGEPLTGELPDDPRLHTIVLRRNVGVAGVVRNIGIRASRSPFVAFLDDDNEWLAGHLAPLLDALRCGASFAYSGAIRVLPDGRELDRLASPFDRDRLRHENFVDINTVAVQRGRSIRFSRRRRRPLEVPGEDWVFVWRRSRHRTITALPECTVRYLINPASYFWPGHAEFAETVLDGTGAEGAT